MVAERASKLQKPNEALFIDPAIYEWRALEEFAIHAYWYGDKRAALKAYEELRSRVPDSEKARIEQLVVMCKREVGVP